MLSHKDHIRIPEYASTTSPSSTKQRRVTLHPPHTNIIHVPEHPKSLLSHMPHMLPAENDEGYREYKLKLLNLESKRIKHLVTQMKFRIMEGGGEAIYEIGVADDGTPQGLEAHEMRETLDNITSMARQLQAECTVICERIIHAQPPRRVVEMSVKQKALETYLELNTIFVAACFVIDGEEAEDADDDLAYGAFGQADDSADDEEFFENEFACSMENLGICMGGMNVEDMPQDGCDTPLSVETSLGAEAQEQQQDERSLHLEWLFGQCIATEEEDTTTASIIH